MRPPNSANNNSGSKSSDDGDVQIIDLAAGSSARRQRGRPAGSKNKPQRPVVVTRDSPMALRSNVLEIASGADVMEAVAALAKRRHRGISVLSGSGKVGNVSVRQPGGAIASFVGEFQIICLQGAFLPPPSPPESSGMTAFLVGEQGQVVGGTVTGQLLSLGTVTLIAASFANATLERLPLDSELAPQQQQQQQQQQRNQEINSGSEQSQKCEDQLNLFEELRPLF